MFARFGVGRELLEAAGVVRVDDAGAAEFGIKKATGDLSGIVFPYFIPNCNGRVTCRLRRDHPEIVDGKPRAKYLCPFGDCQHVYFPPNAGELLKDPRPKLCSLNPRKRPWL